MPNRRGLHDGDGGPGCAVAGRAGIAEECRGVVGNEGDDGDGGTSGGELRPDASDEPLQVEESGEAPRTPQARSLAGAGELGSETPAAAGAQCCDGAFRHAQHVACLGMGQTVDLAQDERATLLRGDAGERLEERRGRRLVGAGHEVGDPVEIDRILDTGPAPVRSLDVQYDPFGDLEQPGPLELGLDAALERALGIEEDDLNGIFGFFARPEPVVAIGEHGARMRTVQNVGAARMHRVRHGGWQSAHDAARAQTRRGSSPVHRATAVGGTGEREALPTHGSLRNIKR